MFITNRLRWEKAGKTNEKTIRQIEKNHKFFLNFLFQTWNQVSWLLIDCSECLAELLTLTSPYQQLTTFEISSSKWARHKPRDLFTLQFQWMGRLAVFWVKPLWETIRKLDRKFQFNLAQFWSPKPGVLKLPKFNSSPLKNDGLEDEFPFGISYF